MNSPRLFALSAALLAMTACAQTAQNTNIPTRLEANPLGIHASPVVSDGVTEQSEALRRSASGIVRASTVKGAMVGAAVGCGIGVLAANARSCAKTLAIGAASGAVIGKRAGNRDVAQRVELASPNGLVRNLRKANGNLASLNEMLPVLLAQQDAELNRLTMSFAANQINKTDHDRRVRAIRDERAALAETLTLSASEVSQAALNLRDASAKGHSGLEWHINATEQLAKETLSARSSITLL